MDRGLFPGGTVSRPETGSAPGGPGGPGGPRGLADDLRLLVFFAPVPQEADRLVAQPLLGDRIGAVTIEFVLGRVRRRQITSTSGSE